NSDRSRRIFPEPSGDLSWAPKLGFGRTVPAATIPKLSSHRLRFISSMKSSQKPSSGIRPFTISFDFFLYRLLSFVKMAYIHNSLLWSTSSAACYITETRSLKMTWKQNRISFLLLLALSSSRTAPAQTAQPTEAVYKTATSLKARHSTSDFLPDAKLTKKIWKQANWAEFDHSMDGKRSLPTEKTRIAAVWTEKYVYFAFWSKYERLNVFEGEDATRERW